MLYISMYPLVSATLYALGMTRTESIIAPAFLIVSAIAIGHALAGAIKYFCNFYEVREFFKNVFKYEY